MAIIPVSEELLCKLLQKDLLLPRKIESVKEVVSRRLFELQTDIAGFGKTETVKPIYQRSVDGTVILVRFDRG